MSVHACTEDPLVEQPAIWLFAEHLLRSHVRTEIRLA